MRKSDAFFTRAVAMSDDVIFLLSQSPSESVERYRDAMAASFLYDSLMVKGGFSNADISPNSYNALFSFWMSADTISQLEIIHEYVLIYLRKTQLGLRVTLVEFLPSLTGC